MGNKIIVGVFLVLLSLTVKAQSIPIQLMVVDQNGFEMPNTQVKLRLTMRGDTTSATGQYQEVHNVVTNDLGIVSLSLGGGIVTSNSQVLDFDFFDFGMDEPFIKTELDTTLQPTSYQNLGWMRYRYPILARRALWADSSNTALESINSYSSEISDSSKYLINEKEEWYLDSSESNELQILAFDEERQVLSISDGNEVQIITRNEFFGNQGELLSLNVPSNAPSIPYFSRASKTHFYSWSDSVLYSAPIETPWLVDTTVFNFVIVDLFVEDSLIIGHSKSRINVEASTINGSITYSQNLSIGSNWSWLNMSYRNGKVSIYAYTNSYYKYLKVWDLNSNSISTLNSGNFNLNLTLNAAWLRGNKFQLIDRFTGLVVNEINFSPYYQYYVQIDTTLSKLSGMFGSSSSGIYLGTYDTTSNSSGSPVLHSQINLEDGVSTFGNGENTDGSEIYRKDNGSESYFALVNPNKIASNESVSQIYLKNYNRSHPEVQTGGPYIIRGESEFILMFRSAKNVFIDGKLRSGFLIYRIPIE